MRRHKHLVVEREDRQGDVPVREPRFYPATFDLAQGVQRDSDAGTDGERYAFDLFPSSRNLRLRVAD